MDGRAWLETDRPGECIAVRAPLQGVRLLSAQNSDRCWREYHLVFTLCLVSPFARGVSASYTCRGSHNAGAGELMAFEPGDHHVTTRVRGGRASFDVVGIDPIELARATDELGLRGRFHFRSPHLRSPEVARAFAWLVRGVAAGVARLELECRYATFLQRLVEQCSEGPVAIPHPEPIRHSGIRAARNYLRDNFRDDPSLAELAQCAGLTRFAFAHAFTQHMGLSPHAYLKLRRVGEARMLVERGVPIADGGP